MPGNNLSFAEALGISMGAARDIGVLFCSDTRLALGLAAFHACGTPVVRVVVSSSLPDNRRAAEVGGWVDVPELQGHVKGWECIAHGAVDLRQVIQNHARCDIQDFLVDVRDVSRDERVRLCAELVHWILKGMFLAVCGMDAADIAIIEGIHKRNMPRGPGAWDSASKVISHALVAPSVQ